ncbi:MAG: 16S rRNA (cytidine(1402)-2'-O)-methyltransferase [Dehalococcoidia bacterium]
MLYVVGTPIGNLEDISLRALNVLREVSLIAAEDTRKTRRLLARYDIKAPLTSYHEHNKTTRLPRLLEHLQNEDIALVSEAGMPGLSDPGYELIRAAIERGIEVVPVPGPSAVVTALVVSGLPAHSFVYLGFLPRRKGERRRLLASLADETRTMVAFEAPHRLLATLRDISDLFGQRRLALCRELTKLHEEVFRGTANQALQHFQEPRGEFTLVIEGAASDRNREVGIELMEELARLRKQGVKGREAVSRVAQAFGIPRNRVYRAWLEVSKESRE